jgi:hypothetical protein
MEAAHSSETPANFSQTARCHIVVDGMHLVTTQTLAIVMVLIFTAREQKLDFA